MSEISYFESRSGKLSCPDKDVFTFVTDIRNFEAFIPQGSVNNWQADRESCSFSVSMVGTVSIRLAEKEMYSKVVFKGDALKKNDFSLTLYISGHENVPAEVKVSLSADLNPILKKMAAKPIRQFLEILIVEMESFNGWKDIKEQNQPL
jgi:carbon monoxide dehydrogenase subunit G